MSLDVRNGVRAVSGLLLVAYALAVSVVLLSADPTFATDVIRRSERLLNDLGVARWVTEGARVQMMLNAAVFAPLTALASVALPRCPWGNWVAFSFIGSGAIEVFQAFALEPRSAEYVDVVSNTLGALIGAVAVLPFTRAIRAEASSTG